MKRVFPLLMAFYVMVLVFAPCVDDDFSFCSNSPTEISSSTTPSHQDQHDCCSPFCTCSCCSIPFEMMKPFIISQNFTQHQTLPFFFDPNFLSRNDFSIWEPPKA
ncbi:MAG: hypothetical protein NTW10_13390 [Bacteroidetes bacterium]|nr:hypothetical protein [Bacteroidota bacterium]